MINSKHNTTIDFLVTFFIGERISSQTLSNIVKNRQNLLFIETLGLPKDFILPFFQEKTSDSIVYTLKQNLNATYKATLLGEPCNYHTIHTKDYITFKNNDNTKVIKALFIGGIIVSPPRVCLPHCVTVVKYICIIQKV